MTVVAVSFGRYVLDRSATPIINKQEKIKSAFQGILDVVQTVTSAIRTTFAGLIDSVQKKYDESISPLLKSFSDGISKLAEVFLDTFQANILPVLQNAADRFADFTTSTLQPLIDKFLEFAGKRTEGIQ